MPRPDPCNPCDGCIPGEIPNDTFKQMLLSALCGVLTAVEEGGGGGAALSPSIFQSRLTLTSGTPVTTSNVTGATTIYLTPYLGNQIWLYSGSVWVSYSLSEISLALGTLVSGKN